MDAVLLDRFVAEIVLLGQNAFHEDGEPFEVGAGEEGFRGGDEVRIGEFFDGFDSFLDPVKIGIVFESEVEELGGFAGNGFRRSFQFFDERDF